MMKTQSENSFSKKKGKRAAFDFYPTPAEATHALLSEISFDGDIWEPACGDGAIAKILTETGYHVVGTDLVNRGYGTGGVNFLHQTKPMAKNIITNPPYGHGLADKFCKQALKFCRQTGGKVVMLLNLASLCHPIRTKAFQNTPPKLILALDDLICYPNGIYSKAISINSNQRYCWVVWEMGYNGRPEFWWISTKDFRDKHLVKF